MANPLSDANYEKDIDEHVWVTVRDGTRLSATLIRPADQGRFPVIFRCDGYRKDLTRKGEARQIGEWFAARGYIYVLMDIRGTGNSEGVALDEYTQQELEDAYDAIEWLAVQPWSTGAVGMWGKSYSGFNAIMTAMLRPPHLKAILPIYATDDRYTDDVHYWGGLLLVGGTSPYPLKMIYTNPLPPNPSLVGDSWKEMWRQRVDESPPWYLEWCRQQTDGPYWRHGSLRGQYGAIEVPVFMVGGWKDGYTDSIPRMLSHLKTPCKAIIGPWGHQLPHISSIKPRVDFLTMKLRWWDHWLKNIDTGFMDEPPIQYYMQDYNPPGPLEEVAGEWRSLDRWPDADSPSREFYFGPDGSLSASSKNESDKDVLPWSLKLGMGEWQWCLYNPESMPADQRSAEPNSLVYTTQPLGEPFELLGRPEIALTLSASQSNAQLFARLCDVAPNGESTLVAWAALNLTHRDGHTNPQPLEPGQPYRVSIDLNGVAWRFRAGHRIRILIGNHDWPRLWPAPRPFDLEIHHDPEQPGSLYLPLAPAIHAPATMDAPFTRLSRKTVNATVTPNQWEIIQERPAGKLRFVLTNQEAVELINGSLAESTARRVEISVPEDDPAGAELSAEGTTTFEWPEVTAKVTTALQITCTPTTFEFKLEVTVTADEELFSQRNWHETIPRQWI